MERIKYRFIVYNKLWSNPKMNLYVTNPQFNNIHAVAHLHPGVHPCLLLGQEERGEAVTQKREREWLGNCSILGKGTTPTPSLSNTNRIWRIDRLTHWITAPISFVLSLPSSSAEHTIADILCDFFICSTWWVRWIVRPTKWSRWFICST